MTTKLEQLRKLDKLYAEMDDHKGDTTRIELILEEVLKVREVLLVLDGKDEDVVFDATTEDAQRAADYFAQHADLKARQAAWNERQHRGGSAEFDPYPNSVNSEVKAPPVAPTPATPEPRRVAVPMFDDELPLEPGTVVRKPAVPFVPMYDHEMPGQ